MRNVDKIKGLENRIEELKRREQKLTEERDTLKDAVQELQSASDAVMISIALAYGTAAEDGSTEIRIPRVNVAQTRERFALKTNVEKDTTLRLRVVPLKTEAEG